MRALLWISAALIAWTQVGYALLLAALAAVRGGAARVPAPGDAPPLVSLIVAAYREEAVIAAKVANALALDWPRDRLEVIVAVDGGAEAGADATAERARAAGADRSWSCRAAARCAPRTPACARHAATCSRSPTPTRCGRPARCGPLAAAFADPRVGYACGRVAFVNDGGTNQEGLYWRYEMWLRGLESALASVTAGNGAIYAVRREAYIEIDPVMGHDLSFPFNMVKRGWRAVDVPDARATEKMVPSIEGEWVRKRRMMSHAWPIVLRGGLLDPRGYPPLYALMVLSHRVLRYATPLLHVVAALATLALLARGRARVAAAAQAALLAAAAAGGRSRARPLLLARYYVLTTASLAAGLVRPPAPRNARRVGRAGGDAVTQPSAPTAGAEAPCAPRPTSRRGASARWTCSAPASRSRSRRRCSPSPRWRSGSRAPAIRSTASGGSAATACRSTCSSCARWSRAPRRWARA